MRSRSRARSSRARASSIWGESLDAIWNPDSLGEMSLGATIAVGAVIGLALGIVVSVTTDVPLAPEIGLVLGALVAWLWRRERGPAA